MDASTNKFKQRIATLEKQINSAHKKVQLEERCVPTMLIIGAVVPVLIWGLLYFISPSFVQKKEGTKYVRDNWKTFLWAIVITVVIWLAMFLFSYCSSEPWKAMLCMAK